MSLPRSVRRLIQQRSEALREAYTPAAQEAARLDAVARIVQTAPATETGPQLRKRVAHPAPIPQFVPPERPPTADDISIEAWLATNKPQRLPKRAATAPSIAKIRQAAKNGNAITFTRGQSGRTVTFNPGPIVSDECPVHDEGGIQRRRRKKRSPPKKQTLP